jgi:hypothetical protein
MAPPASLPRCAALALLFGLGGALAGCGHPASREECEELFAKSAQLELAAQRITDPKLVAERTAAARAAEGETFAGHCQGRRITKSALECVRRATTSEQLDRCL